MLLLALDTSTAAVTVALHDGHGVVAEWSVRDAKAHAEQCAPGIRRILAVGGYRPSDISLLVVGRGPGPFTGLRVGIMTAVVFGYALDVPVAGVCSLDALAWRATRDQPQACRSGLVVATDARRREVYWARYAPTRCAQSPAQDATTDVETIGAGIGGWRRVAAPAVAAAARIAYDDPSVPVLPVAGQGGRLYPHSFGPHLEIVDVDAAALAEVALHRLGGRPPEHAEQMLDQAAPLYLRRPDALTTAERLRASQ